MAAVNDFADSTDWLNTPLAALAPLESALRCQVCKDFFSTPMITSCSHTFCSLCIRRYLSQEGRCPACRESDQEMKLRRNWAVEELVIQFTQGRQGILDFAKTSVARDAKEKERPKKRRKIEQPPVDAAERRSTRSQTRYAPASQTSQDLPSTQEEVADSGDEGSVYEVSPAQQQPHDGLVECPCCHRRMKEALINSHLDRCISGQAGSTPSPSTTPTPQIQAGSIAYSQTKTSVAKERLPFINYSLLNDNALRKKLKELGIPSTGTKELMRKRHTEWVNLWNANCDSQQPKSKRDLLRELDIWERTLGKPDKGVSGVMVKEFDRDQWQKSNKNDFDDLIRKAREKRQAALAKQTEDPSDEQDALPQQNGETVVIRENNIPVDMSASSDLTSDPTHKRTMPLTNGNGHHQIENESLENNTQNMSALQQADAPISELTTNGRPRMFQ